MPVAKVTKRKTTAQHSVVTVIIITSYFQVQKEDKQFYSNEVCLLAVPRFEKLLSEIQRCQKVLSKETEGLYKGCNSAALATVSPSVVVTKSCLQRIKFSTRIYYLRIWEQSEIPTLSTSQLPSVHSPYFHSFHIFTTLNQTGKL